MKRTTAILAICLCLLLTGCSNNFARQEYNATEKIAREEDHYAKVNSVFNQIQGGYSLDMDKFDGRQTLWSESSDAERDIEVNFSFTLSSGKAKIVHIDDAGNVTTIVEFTPETSEKEYVKKTISLKSGQNRLKIVGYGCEGIEMKMVSGEFQEFQ